MPIPPGPCSTPTVSGSPTSVASSLADPGQVPDWVEQENAQIMLRRSEKLDLLKHIFAVQANLDPTNRFCFMLLMFKFIFHG